jgi:hypothetical protein
LVGSVGGWSNLSRKENIHLHKEEQYKNSISEGDRLGIDLRED